MVQHDGCHDNDDVIQPQYAEIMPTRRVGSRHAPVSRRPYDDMAQYASIDHRITGLTYIVVVDDDNDAKN